MAGPYQTGGAKGTRRVILGAHLVWHGYGHWMPNDPRGSGSTEIRKDELGDLGEVHFGRKRQQPTREELREFYRNANPRLEFEPFWFDAKMRQTIGDAIGRAVEAKGYTVWQFALCSNHAHGVVRTHRDRSEVIWDALAQASREALRATCGIDPSHPVWSHRPYKVFLYTPDQVIDRIDYVLKNPEKEGLPRQSWWFVKPYQRK